MKRVQSFRTTQIFPNSETISSGERRLIFAINNFDWTWWVVQSRVSSGEEHWPAAESRLIRAVGPMCAVSVICLLCQCHQYPWFKIPTQPRDACHDST